MRILYRPSWRLHFRKSCRCNFSVGGKTRGTPNTGPSAEKLGAEAKTLQKKLNLARARGSYRVQIARREREKTPAVSLGRKQKWARVSKCVCLLTLPIKAAALARS